MDSLYNKKLKLGFIGFAVFIFLFALLPIVNAHCPLCTGATIVGVGITRSLGWDDTIVGVFLGGMIISSALWVNNILAKRNVGGNGLLRITSLIALSFVLTLLGLYYAGLFGLGNPYRIFGMEKIVFGSLSGSIMSLSAFWFSSYLKNKNYGKVFFNYQTLVLTLVSLILNIAIFSFLLK